ncbi:MAG: hypothetical protein HXS53_12025 [Theionarchaea archaeon]|nr:hypothetical protein [Theionarchaea archaeon]
MKIKMNLKFFYLNALIGFLFCVFSSLHYNALFEGLEAGLISLIIIITFYNVKTKEIKELTGDQLEYRMIILSLAIWILIFITLAGFMKSFSLFLTFIPIIIVILLFGFYYQRKINRRIEKIAE